MLPGRIRRVDEKTFIVVQHIEAHYRNDRKNDVLRIDFHRGAPILLPFLIFQSVWLAVSFPVSRQSDWQVSELLFSSRIKRPILITRISARFRFKRRKLFLLV